MPRGELGESAENASNQGGDAELLSLLRHWRVPKTSLELDQRVLAGYRNQISWTDRWRRLFFRPISVPLPLAAAFLLVLVFLAWRSAVPPKALRLEVPTPAREFVRVEVPVIREKIVTRTVYRQPLKIKDKHMESDRGRSAAVPANGALQSLQAAVRLADLEPTEKIQLRVLGRKGVSK